MYSDIQEQFLIEPLHSWNLLSGSVSSGKTHITTEALYFHLHTLPDNCLFIIVGRTGESVYDNVLRGLLAFDVINDFDYHKAPQRIIIRSKNIEIACIGADNESSWTRVQGKTTAGALFDELTNIPENLVKTVAKGCRHNGVVWPKIATTNPDAPAHWVKKQLIDNKELDIKIWYFTLTDNPVLTEEYKKEIINTYTGAMYDRMILGKWVVASGVVYNEFNRATHVKIRAELPKFKDYVLGIDWGYTNPLAILLVGIDYDGNYWVIDEIYLRKQLIDETLRVILDQKGWLNIDNGFKTVKPSFAYADSNRPEYINQFDKLTGITTIPAAKEVEEGISLVQQKLKLKDNGECSLYFLDECINTLSEVESYRRKVTKNQQKDDVEKENDHAMDSLRYIVFTRERARVKIVENNPMKGRDPFADWSPKVRYF